MIKSFIHDLVIHNPTVIQFLVGESGNTRTNYTGSTLTTNLKTFNSLRGKNRRNSAFYINGHIYGMQCAKSTQLHNVLWLITKLS